MIPDPVITEIRKFDDERLGFEIEYDISYYDPHGEMGGRFVYPITTFAQSTVEEEVRLDIGLLTKGFHDMVGFAFPRDVERDVQSVVDTMFDLVAEYGEYCA